MAPILTSFSRSVVSVGYGLCAGLTDAGFPVKDVEMTAALALGLADKDIAKRWLEGEPVFRAAAEMKASRSRSWSR